MSQNHTADTKKLHTNRLFDSINIKQGEDSETLNWQQQQTHRLEYRDQYAETDVHKGTGLFIKSSGNYEAYGPERGGNGFTKNKNVQIHKLNELKKQYEFLKQMHIEDSLSRASRSSSSAASQSVSSRSKTKRSEHSNYNKAEEFQRKQLELMVNNSMMKIEELLKKQVEYKRKIHQLSRNPKDESNIVITDLQKKEKELHQLIKNLKQEEQRLRGLNRDLTHRVGELEGDLIMKDAQIRKYTEEKRKTEQKLLIDKQRYMHHDIEIKRLKMQKQILEKEKNSEINQLTNQIKINEGFLSPSQFSAEILKLTDQIKLKDQRYGLLLKDMEAYRSSKLNSQDKGESFLNRQIQSLKTEFSKFRQGNSDKNLAQQIGEFQKLVDEENLHKNRLLDEIRELRSDYERVNKENKKLNDELQNADTESKKAKKELNNLRKGLDVSENARVTLSVSHMDQNAMITRLKNSEILQANNEQLKKQYGDFKKLSRAREHQTENEMRQLLRKVDELNFQVEILKKQGEFNLQLAQAKSKADLELLQNQQNRALKERDEWKRQFHNMKAFYEQKMMEIKKESNQAIEQYGVKFEQQEGRIKQVQAGINHNLQQALAKHQSQQSILLHRLESLTESNEKLAVQNSQLIRSESDLRELKHAYRQLKAMNESVNHLWEVKEQEYANINELMKELV